MITTTITTTNKKFIEAIKSVEGTYNTVEFFGSNYIVIHVTVDYQRWCTNNPAVAASTGIPAVTVELCEVL